MSRFEPAAKPVIGLVGGIGAGKSRVSAALARRGARGVRRARSPEQRGWPPPEVAAREQAQLPLAEKAARADVAVDNSGSPADLEPQLDRLLARLGIDRTPAVDGRRYDEVRA